ncbi:zinc finger, CCHC-type containing protein [Tanacetum coccineum]
MAGNTVKEMTTNFRKLDKFEGHDFRRWQKKMHFLLTTLKVVYVLTTPIPELLEDATVEAIRIRAKWENDDYICRGHILNGMSDSLFDVYTNVDCLRSCGITDIQVMAEESYSKKFLVDAIAWWIDSGATTHVCDDHFAPVHGRGSVVLEFSSGKSITLFNVLMLEMSKDDLIPAVDENMENVLLLILQLRGYQEISWISILFTVYVLRRILDLYEAYCNLRDLLLKRSNNDEIGSIMENNTWVLSDLPPGCKPLGCNGSSKRRMKSHGTIDKFKADGLLYHNSSDPSLDVQNRILKWLIWVEVYMKQSEGFVMPGNEHKFSMKDMGEADVILGIKIKHENKGIVITQSHYIEKILKKFNRKDCSPMSTPMDPVEKLKLITGKPMDQLKYYRAIGCLMYAMTSTRPDIAYAVGRLSRFISNPSRQHWQAITRVFKYLKGTMNYGLSYMGYPSVLEGYSDASWINHVEDSSSTSGWVFLLGGRYISWASKEAQHASLVYYENLEFVALAAAWVYNGKSRHLGVRHSMIRELIMNGVISIEFVRSQKNLADHLTKGLISE